MVEEDDHLPLGLASEGENDDGSREDAAALFSINLEDDPATPINLDEDGGGGATRNSNSNGSAPSVAWKDKSSKRKSPV
jgi:hypothetical protein